MGPPRGFLPTPRGSAGAGFGPWADEYDIDTESLRDYDSGDPAGTHPTFPYLIPAFRSIPPALNADGCPEPSLAGADLLGLLTKPLPPPRGAGSGQGSIVARNLLEVLTN